MATFALSPISSPNHYTSTSPRSTSQYFAITQPPPSANASTPRRPTLTLNTTSCSRSLGRGHTGLRLDTASAPSSPTYRNTYVNAYTSSSPVSQSQTSSPLRIVTRPPRPASRLQEITSESELSHEAPPASPLQSSSLSHNQEVRRRSILVRNHSVTMTQTEITKSTTPRRKAVSFSEGPIEYITNTLYTLRHSDIPSRSPSPAVVIDDTTTKLTIPAIVLNQSHKHALSPSPLADESLALSTCHHAQEDDYETDPKTPVAGRRKRQREWVWTLGALPGMSSTNDEDKTSSSSSSETD